MFGLLDLIAPPSCAVCDAPVKREILCAACRAFEATPLESCPQCGEERTLPCLLCLHLPPPWERLSSPFLYTGALREALLCAKYQPHRRLTAWLAHQLARSLDPAVGDIVVPLPASRAGRRERGFDQGELIATTVANYLNLPVTPASLLSKRGAHHQSAKSIQRRISDGAPRYVVTSPTQIIGRRVLLVDDVVTTGATLVGAARALLHAGVLSVSVAAIARSRYWWSGRAALLSRNETAN